MIISKKNNYLLLRASILMSLILFASFLIVELGLLSLIINSDKSKISIIIIFIYTLATFHWFYNVLRLDKEISNLDEPKKGTLMSSFLENCINLGSDDRNIRLSLLEDELSNRHALGYLTVDILLKLGLTGTVIGFILMLLPIGQIQDFDPQILQKLLSTMSGGMAVALYTTLTGLVTSILLKFQYFVLDSSLSNSLNYLSSKSLNET
tara:strand:- start:580 stop:1203 length:624 start_codon:yes stop_codon:yes gene_type:complete